MIVPNSYRDELFYRYPPDPSVLFVPFMRTPPPPHHPHHTVHTTTDTSTMMLFKIARIRSVQPLRIPSGPRFSGIVNRIFYD